MDPASFAAGALTATVGLALARFWLNGRAGVVQAAAPHTSRHGARPVAVDPAMRPSTAPLGFLASCKPEQLARRLVREHPYLAAYVLEQLEPAFMEQTLAVLAEPRRSEVIEMLTTESPLKVSGEAFIALLGRLRQPEDTDLA